jgi:hypothetical protein
MENINKNISNKITVTRDKITSVTINKINTISFFVIRNSIHNIFRISLGVYLKK